MSYDLIIDDQFQRANTSFGGSANSTLVGAPDVFNSPSVGGAWIDLVGSNFEIFSHLLVTAAGAGTNPPLDCLYRPSIENFQNGKVLAFNNFTTDAFGCTARFTPASGGSGYALFLYQGTQFWFTKSVNGAQAGIAGHTGISTGVSTPANPVLEFICQSTDASTTQLTANLYDASDLNTVLATHSFTDTTAALQSAGAWGVSGFSGNAQYKRVQIYQVSTVLSSGVASLTKAYKKYATLGATASSGGVGTLSYQWYRSTTPGFTPGAGNILSGKTSLSFTDSGLTAGATYYYKLVTTDSTPGTPQTVTSNQVTVTTIPSNGYVIGFIGDSITLGTGSTALNAVDTMISLLASSYGIQAAAVNQGVGGTTSTSWAADHTAAMAAFAAVEVDTVWIMLGTNDARNDVATSAATYKSNIQALNAAALSNGASRVVLNYSPYIDYTKGFANMDANSDVLLLSYQPQIDSLVNGGTIRAGDKTAYTYFQAHTSELGDGVHPTQQGHTDLGTLWATAFKANVAPASSGGMSPIGIYGSYIGI